MKSFLLGIIIISYTLFINVSFCKRCYDSLCKASCYYKNKGLDNGYCENEFCKCIRREIYVFNGIGRNDGKYISFDNDNAMKHSISMSSTSDILIENKAYNEIWEKIVTIITKKYPFLTEYNNLNILKSILIDNQIDINNFYLKLSKHNMPLKDILDEIIKTNPNLSNKYKDFLNTISMQLTTKSNSNLNKKLEKTPLSAGTNVNNENDDSNIYILLNDDKILNDKSKLNINQQKKSDESSQIYYKYFEETVEASDSNEYFDEIKENNFSRKNSNTK